MVGKETAFGQMSPGVSFVLGTWYGKKRTPEAGDDEDNVSFSPSVTMWLQAGVTLSELQSSHMLIGMNCI